MSLCDLFAVLCQTLPNDVSYPQQIKRRRPKSFWENSALVGVVSVQCTVYSVQCTVYSVQCTVYTVHCTLYTVHCTLYTVHCTLYTVHLAGYQHFMLDWILVKHWTLYNCPRIMITLLTWLSNTIKLYIVHMPKYYLNNMKCLVDRLFF